jgi:pimeloyl-ACP methyl ester carboxylesterase
MKKTAWLDREIYPFTSQYFAVNGQQLHFIDEGEGETILFVHGTPSWSFDFRHLIKELRSKFRCIAIDHIGFGLSDKPPKYDYSTRNHANTLEKFIKDRGLKNITLVVHDFGGPIGLSVAIKNPSLFKRLIIINSWLWSSESEPEFIKFKRILKSPLLPILYRYFNFSPRYLLPKSFGERKIDKQTLQYYTRPFFSSKERFGPLAFAKSLFNDQAWFEGLWNGRETISTLPTLLIWGLKDSFVTEKYLRKFREGFSNSEGIEIPGCGHFPQEEQPDHVLSGITRFLSASTIATF